MITNYNPKRKVQFNNQAVGDGHPCFITYEAGPTHEGLESAKHLVYLAANSGADAVKFQIADPDKLMADKKQMFSYEVLIDKETGATETVEEPLYDIFVRRHMSREEWIELKRYSDSLGLAFFATIFFEEELQLLEELSCDSVKIASADVNHYPLIKMAARTGMCIQLDTGNSTLGEIENAVNIIHNEGNDRIIIHQCPSGYPARLPSINLRIIDTLRQLYHYPIAYSDHTPGADMDIAAIVFGANLVEKTITTDRSTRGVEHIFSLEPQDMKKFVQRIRDVETAMGMGRRLMSPEEITNRNKARRSVFLTSAAKKGTKINELKVAFRRPGDGITPDRWIQLEGMYLRHDVAAGKKIDFLDLQYE
jgi:N,N'-diacetyllegionaminate synthase